MVSDAAGRLLSPPDAPVPTEAARLALDEVERHQTVQRTRIDMMRSFAESRTCRGQTLLTYFGDHVTGPCGHCDNCVAPPQLVPMKKKAVRQPSIPVQKIVPTKSFEHAHTSVEGETPYPLHATVRHRSWGTGTVLGYEADKMTVLFNSVGYKTLSVASIRRGRLLELEPPDEDRTLG